MVTDVRQIRASYLSSDHFKVGVVSVCPTDLLYLAVDPRSNAAATFVRLNRLLLIGRLSDFCNRTEFRTSYPNTFRLVNLLVNILIIIHWNGCIYFQTSSWIGFGSDEWVYFDIDETRYPGNATLLKMYVYR